MNGDIAALFGGDVDTSNVPESNYDALKPGWYPVMIEKAELKTTKSGTGRYLWLQLNVIDERHNGRKLFANINLVNPNPKAVEIGARELAQLGSACGLLRLGDSTELLDKVIQVRVSIKKDDDSENEVKGYKAVEGGQHHAPAGAVPPVQRPYPQPAAPGYNQAAVHVTPAPPPPPLGAPSPGQVEGAAQRAAPAVGKMPWER
jgi:hypothetical protein